MNTILSTPPNNNLSVLSAQEKMSEVKNKIRRFVREAAGSHITGQEMGKLVRMLITQATA